MVGYKKVLNLLADVILAGNPITSVKELVKAAIDQLEEGNFWEKLYLDAFRNAVQQMKDQLSRYADAGGEITLDDDALKKVLNQDLHVLMGKMTDFDLEGPEYLSSLTEALSKRNALIIGGHKLGDDDYKAITRIAVDYATTLFKKAITKNEAAFRRAILAEGQANREHLEEVASYLRSQFGLSIQTFARLEGKIDTLIEIGQNPKIESSEVQQLSICASQLRDLPETTRWENPSFTTHALTNSLRCLQELLKPEIVLSDAETCLIHCLVYIADLAVHHSLVQHTSLESISNVPLLKPEFLSISSKFERLVEQIKSLRLIIGKPEAADDIERWLIANAIINSDVPWTDQTLLHKARVLASTIETRPHIIESLATKLLRTAREIVTMRPRAESIRDSNSLFIQGLARKKTDSPETVRQAVIITLAKTVWHMTLIPVTCGKEIVEEIGRTEGFSLDAILEDLTNSDWFVTNDGLPIFSCMCSDPASEVASLTHLENLRTTLGIELGESDVETLLKSRFLIPMTNLGVLARQNLEGYPVYEHPISRITMNEERIRELVMGERLYTDPRLAIRELYQNSLDACRYRQFREKYLQLKRGSNPEDIGWKGKIEFTLKSSENQRLILECRDNGVGMERKQIGPLFLRAGERFVEANEFAYEQAAWLALDPSLKLTPNSTFGIGVFSYFMLADRIDVFTRRQNPDNTLGECLHILILAGISIARIYKHDESILPDGGTITQLTLRPEFDNESRVGLSQLLREIVIYCPFNMEISEPTSKLSWVENQLSEDISRRARLVFSEDESFAWWIPEGGYVLADGIKTSETTFGFIVSLHGAHKPTLRTDRNQVLAWDRDWVLDKLESNASTLVDWPELSLSWLWQFSERYPASAQRLEKSLEQSRPKIPLGQSELWDREIDLRAVGCFSADQYLVHGLGDIRFDTQYQFLPLPSQKQKRSELFNKPNIEFPLCLTPWRRAVWLQAFPQLYEDEKKDVPYLIYNENRPVLAPESLENLYVPESIDSSLIASQPDALNHFWQRETGGNVEAVDLVALLHGAFLSQITMGEAVARLLRLGRFGLRSIPGIALELEKYIPNRRDIAIIACLRSSLQGVKKLDKSIFLELLPLSRQDGIGFGKLIEQAYWLVTGLGIEVSKPIDLMTRLRYDIPSESEIRFFGFDRYGTIIRDGNASQEELLFAIHRSGFQTEADLDNLIAKYDWFELGNPRKQLKDINFDQQDELTLQAWSSNFDKRWPWIDNTVFRRGYEGGSSPNQHELLGHAIFWSIISHETLRAAVRRVWSYPRLDVESPNFDLIPDEFVDEVDLQLLTKRFGQESRYADSRFDGIGIKALMLREITLIELIQAQIDTRLDRIEILERLRKFEFAGVRVPNCDPKLLENLRLSKMQRAIMLTKRPNPGYDSEPVHSDIGTPILGKIKRIDLFAFANEMRITMSKAFKVLESVERFGVKHNCNSIDTQLGNYKPTKLDIELAELIKPGEVGLITAMMSYSKNTPISDIVDRMKIWLWWILDIDNLSLGLKLNFVKDAFLGKTMSLGECQRMAAIHRLSQDEKKAIRQTDLIELSAELNSKIRNLKEDLKHLKPLLDLDGIDCSLLFETWDFDDLSPSWIELAELGITVQPKVSKERIQKLLEEYTQQ